MKVSEIMNTQIISVNESATIREVFFLMQRYTLGIFPVVNADNEFAGVVSEMGVLKMIYPDLLTVGNDELENRALPETVTQACRIHIAQIMEKGATVTHPDASVIQLAVKMALHQIRMVPVLENKKVVGIVTITSIFMQMMKRGLSSDDTLPREPEKIVFKLRKTHFGGAEKRIYLRMNLKIPVTYQLIDAKTMVPIHGKQEAESIDISAGGLSIKINQPLAAGDLLNVKFQLSTSYEPIECMMRAYRSTSSPDGRFRTGLMFLALVTKERSQVDRFIRQSLLSE